MHAPGSSPQATFEQAFGSIVGVEGWLTRAQAQRLWTAAQRVSSGGHLLEIGSYHGRSVIVLARAAAAGVSIHAIDPHQGSDRGPRQIAAQAEAGRRDHEAFRRNLRAAGVADRVSHVRKRSQDAAADVPGPLDVVYIDGAHRFGPARADLRQWGAKVSPGGTLLVHDAFSSVGVTLALLTTLVFGARFRYLGRSGSLAEYRLEQLAGTGRALSAARQLAQLPYFGRNLALKLLIVLGYPGEWPY